LILHFFFHNFPSLPHLHSFPTRRSSDLDDGAKHMSEASSFNREIDDSRQYRLPCTRFVQVSRYGCIPGDNRVYVRSPAHQRVERSEEHTSELQSRGHLVCRLLLEKKKKK